MIKKHFSTIISLLAVTICSLTIIYVGNKIDNLALEVSNLKGKIVQIEENVVNSNSEIKTEIKTEIDIVNKQIQTTNEKIKNIEEKYK